MHCIKEVAFRIRITQFRILPIAVLELLSNAKDHHWPPIYDAGIEALACARKNPLRLRREECG